MKVDKDSDYNIIQGSYKITQTIKQEMLKEKLESIKSQDTNLYNHLVNVLKQLVLSNDRDGYHLFEYYCQNINKIQSENKHQYRSDQSQQLKQFVSKQKNILNKPSTGTQQEPVQVGPCGYVPNLLQQSKWLQKAGVGFGQQLTYLIFKSLERFSITKQVKELKFWGKILGSQKDYYIAQSPAEGGDQGQLPPEVEPKGTGINKMTFWVTTDLLSGQWKQLPLITPQQMVVARRIKYTFTGDLQKDIFSNPFFSGKESHILKCQIVRINYTCNLVPRTMYNVNAQDKKQIQPAQQWKMPNFAFLSSLDNWVHFSQNVLKNGRTTLLKPEIPQGEEVDQQKLMKQLQAKDPLEERLKSLSKDGEKAWAIKLLGDCNQYRAMTKNPDYVNYGYVQIKSLIWRGWHLIYHNKQWITVYIGNGQKHTGQWFYPKEPEQVFGQNQDKQEVSEPNFPPQAPKVQGEQAQQPPVEQ